ncbi:MAG: energy-coupling factor transporter transmembrane protein EcfT [Candidatus Accumulibacter sp.]|nr:energy-coupling factor transporter transmembrane protein EcfT [Accumulibacter sp.]
MKKSRLHPATRLLGWLALLVAVQCLSGAALPAACLAVPLTGKRILRRSGRLVWQARWLLISLTLVFAWGIAGEPLWHGAPAPTRQGLEEAAKHLGRLWLVLVTVAALLETMPLADLLAALRTLFAPARRLGIDPDRGAVRLMLALRYVETLPRPRDWKSLLEIPETGVCETVDIDRRDLRRIDGLVMAALLGGLAWICFR